MYVENNKYPVSRKKKNEQTTTVHVHQSRFFFFLPAGKKVDENCYENKYTSSDQMKRDLRAFMYNFSTNRIRSAISTMY